MENKIREQIMVLADEKYKKFAMSLMPGIDNVLGVRLPELRKLAKKIAKDNWRDYLKNADNDYFEEIMLQGMVIGYAKAEVSEILTYVADFVPKINNWSICDSFCSGLKITKDNMDMVWRFIQPYAHSDSEYDIRFGVVMLLNFFIMDDYIDEVLSILNSIHHEGYYVKMAVAWTISMCYVKMPHKTMTFLKKNNIDDFTYNKALQKIIESFKVSKETKDIIREMKRK